MIKDLYNEVFDENGEVRACGREKCKELIKECTKMKHGVNFGRADKGIMNIPNIRRFVSTLK